MRYILNSESERFLGEVKRTAKKRAKILPAGKELWRARLGHSMRKEYHDGEFIQEIPDALSQKEMKPLETGAREGRANSKGIPVLYLSNRPETAMSEVRPWEGSLISCAQFITRSCLLE